MRNLVVSKINSTLSGALGVTQLVYALTGLGLAVFVLFFLLEDGRRMWQWLLASVRERHRSRIDGAGR